MTLQKIFPVLKDSDNRSIPCSNPGCRRVARHIHHMTPQCEGGSDEQCNLTALCQKCHVAHHSAQGDFAKWGKVGGIITAQKMVSIPNLKQFQGEAGRARWAIYCQRQAERQMGWVA